MNELGTEVAKQIVGDAEGSHPKEFIPWCPDVEHFRSPKNIGELIMAKRASEAFTAWQEIRFQLGQE